VRELSAAGLTPTSGEIVTQNQLGGSRTDSAVRVRYAQPRSRVFTITVTPPSRTTSWLQRASSISGMVRPSTPLLGTLKMPEIRSRRIPTHQATARSTLRRVARRGTVRRSDEYMPAPRRSQAEMDTFNRRSLTRFGIDANQFGASSCHKGATAALVDDRRQLFAYAGVDGDWNLGILTRPRGGRLLRSDGSAADRPQRYPPAPALR
jgi:hypothetical protein